MKNAGKSNLQMVQANWEEIERKVRESSSKTVESSGDHCWNLCSAGD